MLLVMEENDFADSHPISYVRKAACK